MSPSNAETLMEEVSLECELTILRRQQALVEEARELETEVLRTLYALYEKRVRNRMPVSLRGGGGELGNLKP
jgi:hypothetical protein